MPRLKKRKIVKQDDLPTYPDLFDFSTDLIDPINPDDVLPAENPYIFDEKQLNIKLLALKERADEREKQLEIYTNLINLLISINK
jgi:hypothetical protein